MPRSPSLASSLLHGWAIASSHSVASLLVLVGEIQFKVNPQKARNWTASQSPAAHPD